MRGLLSRYRIDSDPLRSERQAEALVLGTAFLILGLLLWGGFRALVPGSQDPVVPTAESMTVSSVSGNELATLEDRGEIRARPLFWVTRAPLQAQEAVVEAQPPAEADTQATAKPLKGVKLAGVFGGGDSGGMIVIRKGKKHRVMIGQDLDGWTLDAVAPTEVTLKSADSQATLALERGKPIANPVSQAQQAVPTPNSDAKDKPGAAEKRASSAKDKKESQTKKASKQDKPDQLSLGGSREGLTPKKL